MSTIYRHRFYILEDHPGISGFRDWNKIEQRLVLGDKARLNRAYVAGEWLPANSDLFRLEDGHLPQFQPQGRGREAVEYLRQYPGASCVSIGHKLCVKTQVRS